MPFWPDPYVAAWSALLLTAPLLVWAAIWDLRMMLIPNRISIALALIFVVWAVLFAGHRHTGCGHRAGDLCAHGWR
jgi:Flp pilus assembly protein protease CpaA